MTKTQPEHPDHPHEDPVPGEHEPGTDPQPDRGNDDPNREGGPKPKPEPKPE
jgi:hypothetical protein